jgi:hypothetical protein
MRGKDRARYGKLAWEEFLALSCLPRWENRFGFCGGEGSYIFNEIIRSPLPGLVKTAQKNSCFSFLEDCDGTASYISLPLSSSCLT